MKKASVTLSHLRKTFRDSHSGKETTAVEDFTIDIQPGELVTLLGPSGCGKTTVLRMLAGFETPTSGKILLDGKDITTLAPNQRDSAMVFQSYALFPHMSVIQNVTYGLKLRRITESEVKKRVDRILNAVNLIGYENRRPNELSGGQQQRVALARALVVEPSVLLFDEPLSNLDAKLRESMRNEIRSLQKSLSITAVYVTHDQSEAMAISDRVVVMNKARIEQIGSPYEVYLRPKTRFVADFMGAANFLEAHLENVSDAESTIQLEGHRLKIPFVAQGSQTGGKVLLVARPESLTLGKSTSGSENEFSGTVREYHYLGSNHEYVIELQDRQRVTVRSDVKPNERPHSPNETVRLSFKTENLHLI